MAALDTAVQVLHLATAGLWTGAVVFLPFAVLPVARRGDIRPAPLRAIVARLLTVSRASSLVLFVTGGHLAATFYEVESLTGTTRGHLVLGMLALWLAMTALVEVGGSRMRGGLDDEKVRTPARDARPFFLGAAACAVLVLVDAGLLAANVA